MKPRIYVTNILGRRIRQGFHYTLHYSKARRKKTRPLRVHEILRRLKYTGPLRSYCFLYTLEEFRKKRGIAPNRAILIHNRMLHRRYRHDT